MPQNNLPFGSDSGFDRTRRTLEEAAKQNHQAAAETPTTGAASGGRQRSARPPTPPPKPRITGQRKPRPPQACQPPPPPPARQKSREFSGGRRPKPHRHQQDNQSDDYLLSGEDDDLYAARMNYLKQRRPSNAPPALFNAANADAPRRQKTILTYNVNSQSPTKDLQTLVLALVREHIQRECMHLEGAMNEQNPFEMRNMRLNSFIASTQDIMDYWRTSMLEESRRIIDETIELDEMAWVTPGTMGEDGFPVPLDEAILMSVPPDKPDISKSQVATEYIQAQRGQQASEKEDSDQQLFLSKMLQAEVAASTVTTMFERICNCYKALTQKIVEINYIEQKPETVQAVSSHVEQMKSGSDGVVQGLLEHDSYEAVVLGRTFVRCLIGQIMDEIHAGHKETDFQPVEVQITGRKK